MIPVDILIVCKKDEDIITLKTLLSRSDIRAFFTTSVSEAFKIISENEITIALLDFKIPGIGGLKLINILRSNPRTKDLPVIFLLNKSTEVKYAATGFGTGVVDYLYKPINPNIAFAKVESFIKLARLSAVVKQKDEDLQNLALVINNAAEVICVVNPGNFQISTINPAIENVFGYNLQELPGKSVIDFAVEEHKHSFKKRLTRIIRDNLSSSVFELELVTSDKKTIWTECHVAYQNNKLFLNISDISFQKVHQKKAAKSKETAEYGKKVKETFLANMSHELRTPVNGIIGLTNLLRKTQLDEQQNSMIDLLEVSSQSLLGVINDVLDIAKMEAGKFSIVRSSNNVHDLLRSVYGLLKFKADENNIEFLLEIAHDVPVNLMVDSLRLNQVLMNLLSNAIKFTQRGYVKLSVVVLEKTKEQVKLKFTVEDSGIGIPENRLAKVFDSFEQAEEDTAAKYGGTGLGLAIVKKLIALKGGELTVNSQVGKGSVFSFVNWYTVSGKPKDKTPLKTERTLGQFDNVKILVAEDNLVNQFMLSKMLKDWDIEVEMVDNGQKVLEKLQSDYYDLVLMDTHMPEMNGYDAAKAIRNNFAEPVRSIPIISLSAASFDYEQEEALLSGMNDVLSKPFQPKELHEKIGRLLKIDEELIAPV